MPGTWRDFVDVSVIEKNIADVCDALRFAGCFPSDADLPIIEARLGALMNASLVIHCTNPDTLLSVKQEGRFQSVFENPTKRARLDDVYLNKRRRVEQVLFGDCTGKSGIIYGALCPEGSRPISKYGNVRVVLKNTVRERSTVTRMDSMNFIWEDADFLPKWAVAAAVPILTPSVVLAPRQTTTDAGGWYSLMDITGGAEYFEVQVHGGVDVEDIERLDLENGTILSEEVKKWLQSKRIPYQNV